MYKKMFKFDLFSFVSNIKSIKDDSRLERILQEKETEDDQTFVSALYNMSLYGENVDERLKNPKELSDQNTDILIIQAESYLKRGDFKKSESIYKSLLTSQRKITQNQWFLINIGLVNVHRKREEYESAMKLLDDLETQTQEKHFLSYIKQLKALETGLRGQFEESIQLFTSAIRSFQAYGNPLLIDIGYANRGLIYFINKEHKLAEKDWKMALKYANKAKSKYSEGKNLGNLADIEILKGNFETAKKYLNKAETIFFDLEDMEGVSMIAYNKGFYHLAKKQLEEALKEYQRFENIAQPLPGPYMLDLLRDDFIARGKENGFEDIEKYLKPM